MQGGEHVFRDPYELQELPGLAKRRLSPTPGAPRVTKCARMPAISGSALASASEPPTHTHTHTHARRSGRLWESAGARIGQKVQARPSNRAQPGSAGHQGAAGPDSRLRA